MKKILLFTALIWSVSTILPACISINSENECPKILGEYFEVLGLVSVINYRPEADAVDNDNKLFKYKSHRFQVFFSVRFHDEGIDTSLKPSTSLGLISNAIASCVKEGQRGASEPVESIKIIALSDLTNDYPKGSDITDLFEFVDGTPDISNVGWRQLKALKRLDDYLFKHPTFSLRFIEQPSFNKDVHVKIEIKLENGEKIDVQSSKFRYL